MFLNLSIRIPRSIHSNVKGSAEAVIFCLNLTPQYVEHRNLGVCRFLISTYRSDKNYKNDLNLSSCLLEIDMNIIYDNIIFNSFLYRPPKSSQKSKCSRSYN